jgi:hypothetical protein
MEPKATRIRRVSSASALCPLPPTDEEEVEAEAEAEVEAAETSRGRAAPSRTCHTRARTSARTAPGSGLCCTAQSSACVADCSRALRAGDKAVVGGGKARSTRTTDSQMCCSNIPTPEAPQQMRYADVKEATQNTEKTHLTAAQAPQQSDWPQSHTRWWHSPPPPASVVFLPPLLR